MTPCTSPSTTTPCDDCRKAEKHITHLKDNIRRLSDELRKKDSLLTDFIDTAATQSRIISSKNSAFADTILWDPSSSLSHRPSSCSTPSAQAPWSVVGRGRCGRLRDASPPSLNLSNRFAMLPPDVPADVPTADATVVAGSPSPRAGPDSVPCVAAVAAVDASSPDAAATATAALPSPAATWPRFGARPKDSAGFPPARPAHLPLWTDVVRGEHPASSQQNKELGKSSSFRRKLLRRLSTGALVVFPAVSYRKSCLKSWIADPHLELWQPLWISHPPPFPPPPPRRLLLLLLLLPSPLTPRRTTNPLLSSPRLP